MQRTRQSEGGSPATGESKTAQRHVPVPLPPPGPPRHPPNSAAEAIQTIDAATRSALCRLAYRFLWRTEDAEDVVHDAIILAHQRAAQLRSTEAWLPWLKRIVVRSCLEMRRQRAVAKRGRLRIAEDPPPATPPPEGRMLEDEQRGALIEAIGRLPEKQQVALVLREFEQMSYREIADIMENTESNVRGNAHEARESLRAILTSNRRPVADESGENQ